MRNDDRNELDDMIDGALPGYSGAEPMEDLENRVLHRVQANGEDRRSPWPYRLGFAIPALAAVLLVAVALRVGRNPQSRATKETANVPVSKPRSLAPGPQVRSEPVLRAAKPRRLIGTGKELAARTNSLPKEESFPAPAPITDEERVLAAWVRRAPAEAALAFADLQKRSAEPIQIEPIRIPPLQSDGNQ